MSVHVDPILKQFDFDHLPHSQQHVARLFQQIAVNLTMMLPTGPEKKVAIRWLLHAKDMAVNAVMVREVA